MTESTQPTLGATPDRESIKDLVLYRLFKWSIIMPTFWTYFQGRIYGQENVPLSGRLIVVANHASDFDPPILASCVGRPVAFMAKEELFRVPLLGPFIRLYGAYPVKRGSGDRAALRSAIQAIAGGWAVGLFIEGTRTPDARIHNPKLGAALIAAKTNSPLLPVSVWGTQHIIQPGSAIPKPVPVTIRIGQVIPAPTSSDRATLEAVTQTCTNAIHALHDQGR